jgi:hypothetical protein
MNSQLQDQILTGIAKEMQSDIDREIMWDMLKTLGWTRVLLSRFQDNNHAVDISCWLADACQGAYERNGRDFLFENTKDATMFILRWGP